MGTARAWGRENMTFFANGIGFTLRAPIMTIVGVYRNITYFALTYHTSENMSCIRIKFFYFF
jgi:hypothetical protein